MPIHTILLLKIPQKIRRKKSNRRKEGGGEVTLVVRLFCIPGKRAHPAVCGFLSLLKAAWFKPELQRARVGLRAAVPSTCSSVTELNTH